MPRHLVPASEGLSRFRSGFQHDEHSQIAVNQQYHPSLDFSRIAQHPAADKAGGCCAASFQQWIGVRNDIADKPETGQVYTRKHMAASAIHRPGRCFCTGLQLARKFSQTQYLAVEFHWFLVLQKTWNPATLQSRYNAFFISFRCHRVAPAFMAARCKVVQVTSTVLCAG